MNKCPNCGEKEHPITVIDEELFVFNCDFEWRYLKKGGVKHIVGYKYQDSNQFDVSFCGRGRPWGYAEWYGTGNQEEIESLKELSECKQCITLAKRNAELLKRN